MKRLLCFILFLGSLSLDNLYAQIPGNNNNSPDQQTEETKYERYYEIVLENALSEYYENGSFLVDVQASVERVLVASGYEVVEELPPLEIENLPGLPVIPPGLKATSTGRDSIKVTGFNSSYRLNQLVIRVLIDTAYTQEDSEFINEMAGMVANADRFRGDIVTVERKIFPKQQRGKSTENSLSKATRADTVFIEQPDNGPEIAENRFLGIDWNNPKHLMYVIFGLFVLVLALLIWALKRRNISAEQDYTSLNEELKNIQINPGADENPKDELREFKNDKQAKFEEEKMFIINRTVSQPETVAMLIEKLVNENEDEGLVKAVRAIFSTDPKIIDVLQPYLDDKVHDSILFGLTNIETIPVREKAEEVTDFKKKLLAQKISKNQGADDNHLFEFLNQLTNQQLLHLIRGESDEMIAILLAQLPGERSSFVLQKLDENKRIPIVLKMGKIANIPISIYKKVAAHFSHKALTVSDMKYVAADGVESILNTIDNLPIKEQQSFVNSIAEKDLNLAKKIRKYFVAFSDIPNVDDEVLQVALEESTTDEIIKALYRANESVKDKILSVRPDRESELILSELSNDQEFTSMEIEGARKNILLLIRKVIKSRG
ncbi:MAG: FliG C-terminal domain-containing protein [Balneola sp.]